MPQLAIYLDGETSKSLDRAARDAGVSRSAWARDAIRSRLRNRLPESFFAVLGTFEDDRKPEELLQVVREGLRDDERPTIE